MNSFFYKNKWIQLTCLALLVIGCKTKGSHKEETKFLTDSGSCEFPYNGLFLDSTETIQGKTTFFLRDTFALADWYYYSEATYVMLDRRCFDTKGISLQDSIVFVVYHDERKIIDGCSLEKYLGLLAFRQSLPSYYNFLAKNSLNYEFRNVSIILRHYYGKFLANDTRDDIMYNENVFDFLIQFNLLCKEGKMNEENLEMMEKLIFELKQREGIEEITKSLELFIQDCGGKDRFITSI